MKSSGGKGKCYQRLINLMPAHQTYIESHLGSGAVLRHNKPAFRNIGIDLGPAIPERWAAEPVRAHSTMICFSGVVQNRFRCKESCGGASGMRIDERYTASTPS